ncbi:hypothetical protein [Streptomyces sp. NPDC001743]|uniref:hypothetical protein n=1 Tax=Streptomyces sp. NPDC001743 TaxID=3154397 RepID=UPI0033174541
MRDRTPGRTGTDAGPFRRWVADRRGLPRLRPGQPACSVPDRVKEHAEPPGCGGYGRGVLVWSPTDRGMLTGGRREGATPAGHRSRFGVGRLRDERRPDAVERLAPLEDEAAIGPSRLAAALALAHAGVTSAPVAYDRPTLNETAHRRPTTPPDAV